MMCSARDWLVAAGIACVVAFGPAAYCRPAELLAPASPSAERPEASPETTLPAPTPLVERAPPYILPSPGWPTVDFTRPDPLLDRPYAAQPGFFANIETNVLFLHLHNQLGATVPNSLTGGADMVKFGGNRLDLAVSPRFEVGYRIPDNWGAVSFGYGFLASQGSQQLITGLDDVIQAPGETANRLVYNMWDITYSSREFSLDPHWNLRTGVGARLLYLYFDSHLRFIDPGTNPGTVLTQSETNYVQCYGFWAWLDVERQFGCSGFSAFLRWELTDFFARTGQNYGETVAGNPGQGAQPFLSRFTGSVGPSILREVVGLSYTVPQWNHSRLMLGYQYEQFFQIGRLSPTAGVPDTRGQLDAHGLFLRAELNF
jgi:hypothetical protein